VSLKDGQGALEVALGSVEVTLLRQDRGKVAEAAGGAGVIGSDLLFVDGKSAFLEGASGIQVALSVHDIGEVVEAGGRVGMARPAGFFNAYCTFEMGAGAVEIPFIEQYNA
jgi:hypothetical protein